MKPIKLLIADDEERIRKAIATIIDWSAIGVEICATANDGNDALKKIIELKPEIALLDIRMPGKLGIEVMTTIKKLGIETKIIILSGYDDFYYSQQALKGGAVDYLLKPCPPEEMLSAVNKVCEKIIKQRIEKEKNNQIYRELNRNRSSIREKNLYDMLLTQNSEIANKKAQQLQFSVGNGCYCIAIHSSKEGLFLDYQTEFISECLAEEFKCTTCRIIENIVSIVDKKEFDDKKLVRKKLTKIKTKIMQTFGIIISIGVGTLAQDISEIYFAYQNALKALDMAFFLGTDFIIYYDSIYLTNSHSYPVESENQIIMAIKQRNFRKCENEVDYFLKEVENSNEKCNIIKFSMGIILSLYHFMIHMGISTETIFNDPLQVLENLRCSKNTIELSLKIKNICRMIIERLDENIYGNRFVDATIRYISSNYEKNLTLSNVANEVYISPGYLSTLFKQYTGKSFIDFLNSVRIENACELAKNIKLKSYEISHMVGFQDEKYFAKVFKKNVGVCISEYRRNIKIETRKCENKY